MIRRERKREYKRIKKVFKARDMASRSLKKKNKGLVIKISSILNFYKYHAISELDSKTLAKDIYDRDGKLGSLKPLKPSARPVSAKK